ncbi:MAG: KamA family radical SAM protein [bacterium]
MNWSRDILLSEIPSWVELLKSEMADADVRRQLLERIQGIQMDFNEGEQESSNLEQIVVRDCARSLQGILRPASERRSDFSFLKALRDVARGTPRPDLSAAFFAEVTHLFRGLERRTGLYESAPPSHKLEGREAALKRSEKLDELWRRTEATMSRYPHGLLPEIIEKRKKNRIRILQALSASDENWSSWQWQFRHVARTAEQLEALVPLSADERECIHLATSHHIPFGVTPFYASLMDAEPDSSADRAVRAQVIPPLHYLDEMIAHREDREYAFDFMLERDTSPIDLITRRYTTIVILKPYDTCPQICVYCQRNWEIQQPLRPEALATREALETAIQWIREHPAIHEVLVTGGDPLALSDRRILSLLERLSDIDHVERIRIGTRLPVTCPMRITPELVSILARFQSPGRREICVVTHVEHPYEINQDLVAAIHRLRLAGISVYNQLVFTSYVSRRFEAALLRRLLRLCLIDPYYTFTTKGKEETRDYRVPLARILQEQKEEARLLPGLARTDEAVYNVPGLGKNYLRAWQHRDLVAILPDGARLYEFHPWEKKILPQKSYLGADIPILDYLERLREIGEDPAAYESIWHYY